MDAYHILRHYELSNDDIRLAQSCLDYADRKLSHIERKNGGKFIRHPISTAIYLADRKVDYRAVIAMFNHDTFEELSEKRDGDLKELVEDELYKFSSYLSSEFKGREQDIDFIVDMDRKLTNVFDLYTDNIESIFQIEDRYLREHVIMGKASDMIDNVLDIGNQDWVTTSSTIPQDLVNIYLRLGRDFRTSYNRGLKGFRNDFISLGTRVKKYFLKNDSSLLSKLVNTPKKAISGFQDWFMNYGFSGPQINKRLFKNLCFADRYKRYVLENHIMGKGATNYDPHDNVGFFFRRLCLINHKQAMNLRGRIEGIARRPGNRSLNALIHLIQWQLYFTEFSEKSLSKRTHADEDHRGMVACDWEKYCDSSTSVFNGSLSDLEKNYDLFYPTSSIKISLKNAFHGILDTFFNALKNKDELKKFDKRLDLQYIHAIAFMEAFAFLRWDKEYTIKGIYEK
jgi:hypothetical protein